MSEKNGKLKIKFNLKNVHLLNLLSIVRQNF